MRCIFRLSHYPALLLVLLLNGLFMVPAQALISRVVVTVLPETQIIRARFVHAFTGEADKFAVGWPVISEEFTYLGRKAKLHIYPAGKTATLNTVSIELHLNGVYDDSLTHNVSGLVFEHRSYLADEKKCMIPFKEGTVIEGSPAFDTGFIIGVDSFIKTADLRHDLGEDDFFIRAMSTGDIQVNNSVYYADVTWTVQKQDIALIKRGDVSIRSCSVTLQDKVWGGRSGSRNDIPELHLELYSDSALTTYSGIAFRIKQQEVTGAAQHLPYCNWAFSYIEEGSGTNKDGILHQLGAADWSKGTPNKININKSSQTRYDEVLKANPGTATVKFRLRVQKRIADGADQPSSAATSPPVANSHRKILDLGAGSFIDAPNQPDTDGVFHIAMVGFGEPKCSRERTTEPPLVSAPFSVMNSNYSIKIWPVGNAANPAQVMLSIPPVSELTEGSATTLKPQGFIVIRHRLTARHVLEKKANLPNPFYMPSGTGSGTAASMALMSTKELNKKAGLEQLTVRPVYPAKLRCSTRNKKDSPGPFKPAVVAGHDYTLEVSRYDLAMCRYCRRLSIASEKLEDSDIVFTLSSCFPEEGVADSLVMSIDNIPADHGAVKVTCTKRKQGVAGSYRLSNISQEKYTPPTSNQPIRLAIGSVDDIARNSFGTKVTFNILIDQRADTTIP